MRVEHWYSRLIAYIDERERQPFAWGVSDCLMTVAGAVEVVTGVDHAGAYRGRYASLDEGMALLGMPPVDFVASLFTEVHPSQAGSGDIGALPVGEDWAFGVLVGAHLYVQTEHGLGVLPRGRAQKTFRVD